VTDRHATRKRLLVFTDAAGLTRHTTTGSRPLQEEAKKGELIEKIVDVDPRGYAWLRDVFKREGGR